jgi:hypothetical protein
MKKKLTGFVFSIATLGFISPCLALNRSITEAGINAYRLHENPYNLTGKKIGIGQVELGRPAVFGFDKNMSWNPNISFGGLFYRDNRASSDQEVDEHAAMVAMVMVSKDKKLRGVAPDAKLYASAVGIWDMGGQPEECVSSQYVAQQNGGDVRSINFSFGETLYGDSRFNARLDGNSLLTQCIDWSARVHDTLYVIAGNQGSGGIPIPTDNYNGINTAYSTQRNGFFTKVDFANISAVPEGVGRTFIAREINLHGRRSIGLIAPGSKINVYDLYGSQLEVSGTSFAAPHITASVALLQEYGDRQIFSGATNWSIDSRRHEVTKAVLLNSTDKIKDDGDGLLLGMERTTLSKRNLTWFDSEAYKDDTIPMDMEMGTGHLNVFRGYQQFSGGQWTPDAPVNNKGWNYGTIEANQYQDYVIETPLKAGGFASVTLSWDRLVELNDSNNNEQFDVGESFTDKGLNNLNIYLMPVDSDNKNQRVCASMSAVDSTEHIFCKIPTTGQYKIRVEFANRVNEPSQNYGLAWWTVGSNQ